MTRRYGILAALALSACRQPPPSGESLLPERTAGWQRTALRAIAPPRAGVLRAFHAGYEGPGKLTVELYETRTPATAFEMTQHWREAPSTVFFDKGRYFVMVRWERADRQALGAFVRALQTGLARVK